MRPLVARAGMKEKSRAKERFAPSGDRGMHRLDPKKARRLGAVEVFTTQWYIFKGADYSISRVFPLSTGTDFGYLAIIIIWKAIPDRAAVTPAERFSGGSRRNGSLIIGR